MERINKFLENEHKELYFSEKGIELINRVQEMIFRERNVVLDEKKLLLPGCQLYIINPETIGAFVTLLDDEYCIFVNKGIIEEQKRYLEKLDWSFISDVNKRAEYIEDLIEYGFYFIVFHEYAHIICGHCDAGLDDSADIKAQECEADMFSMDYLVKYLKFYGKTEDYMSELEKLFLSIFFLLEKMQKQNWKEEYNDKIIQNYYATERIEKRDHPLDAQRILYLYEMLNIVVVTDCVRVLPVKEAIIEKIKFLKRLTNKDIPQYDNHYLIVRDSIQELKKSLQDIREKIPRMGDNIEE